jgi:hypothetical protein
MRTRATPSRARPMRRAAASERSIPRPRTNGPRSLMRTTTDFPVERFVTRANDPLGSVFDAAVISFELKVSPVLVRWPLSPGPYHEASVVCPIDGVLACATGGGTGGAVNEREAPHPLIYKPVKLMRNARLRAENSKWKIPRDDRTRMAFSRRCARLASARLFYWISAKWRQKKHLRRPGAIFHSIGLKRALLSIRRRGRKFQDGRAMILRERKPRNPA